MKARPRLSRPATIGLVALVLANVAVLTAYAMGLRINTTASMPTGVYRLTPYRSGPITRGTLVAFCPSGAMRALALARHYLGRGPCPGNVEPLLKAIAAVAGDSVDVSDFGSRVNGRVLPNSGRVARDCSYRPLSHIPSGRYVLPPATVWLYAPVDRSWDSRYYGPQAASSVIGIASPVLILGHAQACTT